MQPMSDRELDKLFQEKFGQFEAQPSKGLWAKIDAETSAPKNTKNSFPILWMAAASVIVILAAGLYFMQPVDTIQLRPKAPDLAAQHTLQSKSEVATEKGEENISKSKERFGGIARASNEHVEKRAAIQPFKLKKTSQNPVNPAIIEDKILKTSLVPIDKKPQPEAVDNFPNMAISSAEGDKTQKSMDIAAAHPIESASGPIERTMPKGKIKSLGDLVNRVIATVDHREDKLIQFTDNDEGTEISGINLGLLKLKHNHTNK